MKAHLPATHEDVPMALGMHPLARLKWSGHFIGPLFRSVLVYLLCASQCFCHHGIRLPAGAKAKKEQSNVNELGH